jgi:3-oxoacyl-[acyl-carrier-protein] synthase II
VSQPASRATPERAPRRVVVTGAALATPLGPDLESTWAAALAGRSAVGPITRFDPTGFPVRFAAEVQDPGLERARAAARACAPAADLDDATLDAHLADLKGRLCAVTAAAALRQAGVPGGPRLGVCVGSEAARPPLDVVAERLVDQQLPSAAELQRMAPSAPTALAALLSGAQGPRSTVSTACTSSSQAVGEGMLRIRRGEVDAMLVGGVDVLVDPIMVTGFALLGALSTRNEDPAGASRPFDAGRDGFVLGEGAGFLVIEEAAQAEARGATILAELTGWGCSENAYRITDSPPDGRGAAQAMIAAIEDAGIAPADVGYVNAHGTSTPMNDASETAGIHAALGAWGRRVPVSSTKAMTGHLVAACGSVELILAMEVVRRGVLLPSVNLEAPDPLCELHHVGPVARPAAVRHALTNAFGFGGSNGSLVVSAWDR